MNKTKKILKLFLIITAAYMLTSCDDFSDNKTTNNTNQLPPVKTGYRITPNTRGPIENLPGYYKPSNNRLATTSAKYSRTESFNNANANFNGEIINLKPNMNFSLPEPSMKEDNSLNNIPEDFPQDLFDKAYKYYRENQAIIKNKKYIAVVDFSKHSSKKRFYIIDIKTGKIESFLVSHGKGSDPQNTGYAKYFSNEPGSLKTSLGFYLTLNDYYGKHGYSLRLKGLSSTNSAALKRAIVIHGASYVTPGYVGRSWGCFAFQESKVNYIIEKLKDGALIYAGVSEK